MSLVSLAAPASSPSELWINTLEIWVAAFLYGGYCILFFRAVRIPLARLNQLEHQGILLGAMVLLFLLSTAQLFILTLEAAINVGESRMPLDAVLTISLLIYVSSCLCSDALLIYRCFVIWDDNFYIVVPPLCLLINSTVFGYLRFLRIFQIISLTTAITVTILTVSRIAWSAYGRRSVLNGELRRSYLGAGTTILESGALYALFVSLHFAFFASGSPISPIMFAAVGQIVGLAPTMIIVRAGMPAGSVSNGKIASGMA